MLQRSLVPVALLAPLVRTCVGSGRAERLVAEASPPDRDRWEMSPRFQNEDTREGKGAPARVRGCVLPVVGVDRQKRCLCERQFLSGLSDELRGP